MKDITITSDISVRDALKKLDFCATKVLVIIGKCGTLLGSITDGDIRRFILNDGDINSTISSIYNKDPRYVIEGKYTKEDIRKIIVKNKIELIPIVDKDNKYKSYYSWDTILHESERTIIYDNSALKDVPIIIMAGGKGTRLKPFTDVFPKPLVPIQEKPIMDWIITEFQKFGAQHFAGTLNYKGKMIEAYYNSIPKNYSLEFVWEEDFYGTAGSLVLLKDKIQSTFIVSNCDIIVKANYAKVLAFHRKNKSMMTVISSMQHHKIPYGVMEFENGGKVKAINEKPEYTFPINTGVYILEKECLDYIPENSFFHITHLMEKLISHHKNVYTYPVNESDYIDIGQWEEYTSAIENLKL